MQTDLKDFRSIELLEDEEHNIVIFPHSKSDRIDENGNTIYRRAYHPIELVYPYSIQDLANKIREGIESWNKYPAYFCEDEKITIEEKYYSIKGFKNATKGKKYMNIGWNEVIGKYIIFGTPLSKGKGYIHKKVERLEDIADYDKFALTVIKLLEVDI